MILFLVYRIQSLIRSLYKHATCNITIEGVEDTIALPLFETLDGKRSEEYVQRVEPSSLGGEKLASAIINCMNLI